MSANSKIPSFAKPPSIVSVPPLSPLPEVEQVGHLSPNHNTKLDDSDAIHAGPNHCLIRTVEHNSGQANGRADGSSVELSDDRANGRTN